MCVWHGSNKADKILYENLSVRNGFCTCSLSTESHIFHLSGEREGLPAIPIIYVIIKFKSDAKRYKSSIFPIHYSHTLLTFGKPQIVNDFQLLLTKQSI